MPGEKILIVDDEKPINDLIRSYVESEGFTALSVFNGHDAIKYVTVHGSVEGSSAKDNTGRIIIKS